MNHIPYNRCSGSIPMIFPDGGVAFQNYKVFGCGQLAVSVCCCYTDFSVLSQAARSFLYQSKCLRKDLIKNFFLHLIRIFFQRFYFAKKSFFFIYVGGVFNLLFYFVNLGSEFSSGRFDFFFEFCCFFSQSIICQCLDVWFCCFNFCDNFFYFF